jgi:uncharacterized protein
MDARRNNETLARISLRPVGSPLPLGMLALAVATLTLAGLQLSWIPVGQQHEAGLVILTFAVPLQALSCIYGFLARDSAAGTGMALQAGGWFSIGMATLSGPPGKTSPALGLLLVGAATVLLVPAVTASMSKMLAGFAMLLTSVRFYLTGAYQLSSDTYWKEAAGIAGLVLAVVAFYAGLAFELEDSRRATLLPTFRRGAGRRALRGNLADEVDGIQHEAGVRANLLLRPLPAPGPMPTWTCLVPGAYARHVWATEFDRDGLERLLPGDGAGVGCVSPLHATSGRFQVMTTGR